jgi:insulysin
MGLFRNSTTLNFIIRLVIISLLVFQAAAESSVEIKKSPLDLRHYKGLYLDNGLKVLLVSDPVAEKAAAALNVEVGSFNEQKDREGLAHFLEHMLFLGTKKYPNASEYSEYISVHGGMNNAWTGDRNTQYLFNIVPEHLEGALDRFSEFFIEPLFNADLVDRERQAVNSEYQLSLKKDGWRINEVKNVTANPNHPIVNFSMGNIETLGDAGHVRHVREDLIKFYNDYYTSDRMALAIVGPQSISALEAMVNKYFSRIPKREVKPNVIAELAYTDKETGKEILIQTLGDYQELNLSFPVPSQRDNYNKLSINYILFQLQQTGPRSLYQLLKQKNWITSISASSGDVTYNQDIAEINFSLTNSGQEHIDDIVRYTFSYLDFMRKIGPQQKMFDELRAAGNRDFIYAEKSDPLSYATALPMAMQRYPLDLVLKAGHFGKDTKFDPDGIEELMSYFTIKNMRLILANPNVKANLIEAKYDVKYSVNNFDSQQMARWQAAANDTNFAFPKSNDFLPSNFSILPKVKGVAIDALPTKIVDKPGVVLWHKQDSRFNLPKQNIVALLSAPQAQSTPRRALLQSFMIYNMTDKLTELGTKLAMAGVGAGVAPNLQGLVVSVSMFSDHEIEVFGDLLKYIDDYTIDPLRFAVFKEDITRDLINYKQLPPFNQGITNMKCLLLDPAWHPLQLLAEIHSITMKDVEDYTREFFSQIQIEALMHGNISRKQAENLLKKIVKQLHINANRQKNNLLPVLVELKNGSKYQYVFEPEHSDSALVSYYQSAVNDDKTIATNALLNEIIDIPVFEQLRTKEQLGYVVGINIFRLRERTGSIFYIESPRKSANYLNNRLNAFLKDFQQKLLKMPNKKLESYKSSLAANLVKKPNSLGEETARYWSEIANGTYRFNFNLEIADQLKSIDMDDVNKYFYSLWLDPKTRRNVITHTVDKNETFVGGNLLRSLDGLKSIKQ